MRFSTFSPRLVATIGALGAIVTLAGAQQKEEFVKAQQANKAALREYTWKSRTELKLKGESRSVKLEQVRYDIDGKLQKTPLTQVELTVENFD